MALCKEWLVEKWKKIKKRLLLPQLLLGTVLPISSDQERSPCVNKPGELRFQNQLKEYCLILKRGASLEIAKINK